MNDPLFWHKCSQCGFTRYCSSEKWKEHEEDCPNRPSLRRGLTKPCPTCGAPLVQLQQGTGVMCSSTTCDYVLGLRVTLALKKNQ